MPRSSVMRFEISTERSHSVAGGISAVFDHWTVGSENSSATQGSSMASVAGKNRAPTKQWAKASEIGRHRNKSASAYAREHRKLPGIKILHWRVRSIAADAAARHHAGSGGARERWDVVSGRAARAMIAGGWKSRPADCSAPIILTGGAGSAAVSIRQPMQQEPMQVVLLVSSGEGAGADCSAPAPWQITASGCAARLAAARAAPKPAIRPESAIAKAAASAMARRRSDCLAKK